MSVTHKGRIIAHVLSFFYVLDLNVSLLVSRFAHKSRNIVSVEYAVGERTLDRLILMLVLIGYYAGVARFGNVSEECKYTASFLEISDTA